MAVAGVIGCQVLLVASYMCRSSSVLSANSLPIRPPYTYIRLLSTAAAWPTRARGEVGEAGSLVHWPLVRSSA